MIASYFYKLESFLIMYIFSLILHDLWSIGFYMFIYGHCISFYVYMPVLFDIDRSISYLTQYE